MSKLKAIVTRRWPEEVEEKLSQHFEVRLNGNDLPMSSEALIDAFSNYDAVFPTVTDRIDYQVLAANPMRARLIGNFGVGFNNIDIDAAKACGLVVTNTPGVLTDATADLAMTLLLSVARRAGEGERHLRSGDWAGWRPTHMMGTQITGKTLGLIGFGRIGQATAYRAHMGFNMRIIFYNPSLCHKDIRESLDAEQLSSIEEVLEKADFVSLHCPARPETHHLINSDCLMAMKSSAFLINTARGDIVDEAALCQSLDAGEIAGAGLDVFENEPLVPRELLNKENVVLLPHLGSATHETRIAMGNKVLENAVAFFKGVEPPNRVA
jgi:lactate dehydrogenase-like 2-hydroxyacid dehydrogenase